MNDRTPLIAVFDVGKTNAKIALVDPALGQEVWSARRANAVVHGAARASSTWWPSRPGCSMRCAARRSASASWPSCRSRMARRRCWSITRRSVAAPDYEDTCFDEVAEEYAAAARSVRGHVFAQPAAGPESRAAALLPAEPRTATVPRVAHILLYPQYWSWRLSGVMATEVTSLGTHTDLWRPHDQPTRRWRASRAGRASCRRCIAPPTGSADRVRVAARPACRRAAVVLRHP
jgi:sugar (pentulose or hexulose) kinase